MAIHTSNNVEDGNDVHVYNALGPNDQSNSNSDFNNREGKLTKITRRTTILGTMAVASQLGTKALAKEKVSTVPSAAFDANDLSLANSDQDGFSMTFLDNNTMMSLIYDIPVGAEAPQSPHGLDELYVVLKGRSKFMVAGEQYPVKAGSILFVKAGDAHYFKDIEEDLQVVIVFSKGDTKKPPYYERNK